MKKSNKKGFTLVELLAVLLVLAILALIAVPMVVNVINKARKQAYQRSIEAFVRATELAMQQWQIENPNKNAPTTLSSYTIETKGDQVICDDDFEKASNGGIILTGCYTEKSIKKYPKLRYTYDGGQIIEEVSYEVGDTFTFGGTGYHVIAPSPSNQDYVVALKDEPLSVEDVNKYGVGHINRYTGSSQGTAYNTNGYGGMAYYMSSTCGHPSGSHIYSGCTTDYNSSEIKYVVDAWVETLPNGVSEARLITYEDLISTLGYDPEVNSAGPGTSLLVTSEVPSWVYNSNYWYWTMSSYDDSSNSVWIVTDSGWVDHFSVDSHSYSVVRPVINVLKSAITKN